MIAQKDAPLRQIQKLTLPLTRLKGVGPKRAAYLAQKGIYTVLDLLFFVPFRYEDRTQISPIGEAEEGRRVLVKGTVVSGREERFFPSHKRLFKVVLRDKEGRLDLLWFHYKKPHLTQYAKPGLELLAYGRIQVHRGQKQMVHPEIVLPDSQEVQSEKGGLGFYPVYPAVPGISANLLRSMIRRALDAHLTALVDPVPDEIIGRLGLPHLPVALQQTHFPSEDSVIEDLNQFHTLSHKRLIFDRFFLVMLTMAFRKRFKETRTSPTFAIPSGLMDDLKAFFPFRLTSHQMRAVEEMVTDFTTGKCMNRLLLGDVGCGKTVIAAVAAHICIRNNHQVAIMVPTQELANQHFEYFLDLAPKMGFRPVLLTGKLKRSERQEVYEGIKKDGYNLVIGTQSLIQKGLHFARLGLVVIDEQQRFGVRDRASMEGKGSNPHILVMTATPIPRTLAISFYGDMDLSFIEGLPEGREPVVTHLVTEGEKRRVFETLKGKMSLGQQAFVICPVIEGSEEMDLKNALEMAEKLKKIFLPPFRVGLVHGRLSPDEREAVMNDFRKGRIHLLVGTTVIEVGVHVPMATVMIIEHPERFGLAQLHQLRGRVGRGKERGLCFLMTSSHIPESSKSRLQTLVENHDGFDIAKKDLALRGHGEFTGTRQAGVGELDLLEMIRESELLLAAKQEAYGLIDSDPGLVQPANRHLKDMVQSILARPLDL
jgi:ATP-dependent DNA helicase RecG